MEGRGTGVDLIQQGALYINNFFLTGIFLECSLPTFFRPLYKPRSIVCPAENGCVRVSDMIWASAGVLYDLPWLYGGRGGLW